MSANEASSTANVQPELPVYGRERPAPGGYHLDLTAIAMCPMKDNGQPTTFADIYRKLMDATILKVPEWVMGGATFETDGGEITVSAESGQFWVLTALRDLVALHKEGINPHRATWFYYGHDWSRDADELYLFFVVQDGKIVRESFSCMHSAPRVLTKNSVDDEPIWHSWPYEHEAWNLYWYRKFYTETLTGQLMVLRPDEPILYNYARAVHDITQDVMLITLAKAYQLLWVAVPLLVAIAFPMLRLYMGILAALCVADLLWKCWATRKIGR